MDAVEARSIGVLLHDFAFGGSERIALRLANAWARAGRRVSILAGHAEGPLLSMVAPEVTIVSSHPPTPRGPDSQRRLGAALAAMVRDARPDVVFVPGNFHFPIVGEWLARPAKDRPAVVAKLSNPLRREDRRGLSRWKFEWRVRRQLRHADAVVAMSPLLAADAHAVLPRAELVVIRQPTLPDERVAPRTVSAGAAGHLLAAGRLAPQKDFSLAVRALDALGRDDLVLRIVGEGPERASLAALAASLGRASQVELPGYVPDLRPHLEHARLFLLTSAFEGFPAVAVEALAAGVPVVATACSPAMKEIITRPELGTVVESREPAALARAIADRLDRPAPDPQVLADAVDRYRLQPVAMEYLRLFDRLLASRPARVSA